MAKPQVKMYVDEDLAEWLENAANNYGRRSSAEVALEIVTTYKDLWEELERGRQAMLDQQRAAIQDISQPYMSGRGTRGEVQKVVKDALSREQKKRGNR